MMGGYGIGVKDLMVVVILNVKTARRSLNENTSK
jgi:hypothetical protein